MKKFSKEEIERGFEKWNLDFTNNPEKFSDMVKKGEEVSYAGGQTETLIGYIGKA